MKCPKCISKMDQINFHGIEVDRCTFCKGIWFDMLEQEHLKELEGSEIIDCGDEKIGKRWNRIDDIDCPKCEVKMLKLVDPKQHHIWFEACPKCYGVFFDAGEFKDFKHETIIDIFRDYFSKERK